MLISLSLVQQASLLLMITIFSNLDYPLDQNVLQITGIISKRCCSTNTYDSQTVKMSDGKIQLMQTVIILKNKAKKSSNKENTFKPSHLSLLLCFEVKATTLILLSPERSGVRKWKHLNILANTQFNQTNNNNIFRVIWQIRSIKGSMYTNI